MDERCRSLGSKGRRTLERRTLRKDHRFVCWTVLILGFALAVTGCFDDVAPLDRCSDHDDCFPGESCSAGRCTSVDADVDVRQDPDANHDLEEDQPDTQAAVCGDDRCEDGETQGSCPNDCEAMCGDGMCEIGEVPGRCDRDCGELRSGHKAVFINAVPDQDLEIVVDGVSLGAFATGHYGVPHDIHMGEQTIIDVFGIPRGDEPLFTGPYTFRPLQLFAAVSNNDALEILQTNGEPEDDNGRVAVQVLQLDSVHAPVELRINTVLIRDAGEYLDVSRWYHFNTAALMVSLRGTNLDEPERRLDMGGVSNVAFFLVIYTHGTQIQTALVPARPL